MSFMTPMGMFCGGAAGPAGSTWDPATMGAGASLSADKLTATNSDGASSIRSTKVLTTSGLTGKYGFAMQIPSGAPGSTFMGVATPAHAMNASLGGDNNRVAARPGLGFIYKGPNENAETGLTMGANDEFFFLLNFTAQTITVYDNGVQVGSPAAMWGTSSLVPTATPGSSVPVLYKRLLSDLTYPGPAAGVTMWG